MTGGAKAVNGDFIGINNASPDLYTTVDNQFAPGTVMYFQGNEGDHFRFELLGTTQTLAGVDNSASSGRGVIQQREQVTVANVGTTSTLILNGSGSYSFNGYLRDTGGIVAAHHVFDDHLDPDITAAKWENWLRSIHTRPSQN